MWGTRTVSIAAVDPPIQLAHNATSCLFVQCAQFYYNYNYVYHSIGVGMITKPSFLHRDDPSLITCASQSVNKGYHISYQNRNQSNTRLLVAVNQPKQHLTRVYFTCYTFVFFVCVVHTERHTAASDREHESSVYLPTSAQFTGQNGGG